MPKAAHILLIEDDDVDAMTIERGFRKAKIVNEIVRAHDGRIELESQEGRGTTFRIWLPLYERKPRLLEAPPHD